MRHPEGDAREVGVHVGSGVDVDAFWEVEGYAARFAREGFDDDLGGSVLEGYVQVKKAHESDGAFEEPDRSDGGGPDCLRKVVYL